MNRDIEIIQEKIQEESAFLPRLLEEMGRVVVGQGTMVERLLIGLLADGHVLMEGVPGLAKTLTVRTLARAVDTTFHRLQFTPDLLPADLIGTLIYDPREQEFRTRKGPVFANIILADEINRSPAKVQSALLEAMQERTVTIGETTFPLPVPGIENRAAFRIARAAAQLTFTRGGIGQPCRTESRKGEKT